MSKKSYKLIKAYCEIEGCDVTNPNLLELHHIIERVSVGTSNDPKNLAILCSNHHSLLHSGELVIHGVLPATKPPNKRILVYTLDGKKNIDVDVNLFVYNKSYKI